jgi:hypothetical protein
VAHGTTRTAATRVPFDLNQKHAEGMIYQFAEVLVVSMKIQQ